MKKIISIFTILLLTITITGCGAKKEENIKGNLPDLMKKLYEGVDIQDLDQQAVTEEKMEYMLGSKDLDIKEAYYSEPLMTSVAHSVVLARANDGYCQNQTRNQRKNQPS